MIDNKDFNYTLIISGQNIQVIQHDTQRNLTYKHGLDVSCDERENLSSDPRPSGESDISGGSYRRLERSHLLLQRDGLTEKIHCGSS